MALSRTKYGIEYDDSDDAEDGHSAIGWIVVLVIVAASISFMVHVTRRIMAEDPAAAEPAKPAAPKVETVVVAPPPPPPKAAPAERDTAPAIVVEQMSERSRQVQSLVMRLREAMRRGDVAMQAESIEKLLSLPGEQVADFEDALVKKLGVINIRRLYSLKNPQWVAEVTVESGDTASAIAHANGSTLASLKRLNPSVDLGNIRPGMKLAVMRKPSFTIIVHKKLATVDLNLNGKLFKRYGVKESAKGISWEPGIYETPANLIQDLRRHGVELGPSDALELGELVPKGTRVQVSPS